VSVKDRGERRRRIKPSYLLPKPVSVGDEIVVEIIGLSKRGDGVAKVKGYVIFIPHAKIGDRVKVKITTIKPSFALGEIISG